MAYVGSTKTIGARIPNQLVPKLQELAAARGIAPTTLARIVLTDFLNAQTAKSP